MEYRLVIRCEDGNPRAYCPDEKEEFEADNDEEAMKKAREIIDKKNANEVWDVTRDIKELQKIIFSS